MYHISVAIILSGYVKLIYIVNRNHIALYRELTRIKEKEGNCAAFIFFNVSENKVTGKIVPGHGGYRTRPDRF